MWTTGRLNRSEHLYGFMWNRNHPEPTLDGWFEQGDWTVEVSIIPIDHKTCEVWVEGEEMGVAYTVNEIEYLCRQYCLDHLEDEDFEGADDEVLNEE